MKSFDAMDDYFTDSVSNPATNRDASDFKTPGSKQGTDQLIQIVDNQYPLSFENTEQSSVINKLLHKRAKSGDSRQTMSQYCQNTGTENKKDKSVSNLVVALQDNIKDLRNFLFDNEDQQRTKSETRSSRPNIVSS